MQSNAELKAPLGNKSEIEMTMYNSNITSVCKTIQEFTRENTFEHSKVSKKLTLFPSGIYI